MTFLLTPNKKQQPDTPNNESVPTVEVIQEPPKINILFKDGSLREWNDFNGYEYNQDSPFFIVLKDGRPVGIYNMDMIQSIEII